MRGMPAIHSSASSILAPGVEQHVEALVGAQQAEEQHDLLVGVERGRPLGRVGEVGEDAVRDHVHALAVDAELVDQPRAPVRGVGDDRVEALVQPPLRLALPGTRFARQHVVRGQHERFAARQQVPVELLHGEPLEVHDVGCASRAPVAQHVGHVLGELQRAASSLRAGAAARHERAGAVEVLDSPVAAAAAATGP